MARIQCPLFSLEAWGTLAKRITFRRKGRLIRALAIPIPTDAKTLIQRAQRLLFQDAVAWWHALSTSEKAAYDKPGREHHMSGYAWFIRSYLLNPPAATFLALTDTPAVYVGEAGHHPKINATEDALEWGTIKEYPSGIIDMPSQSSARGWLTTNQTITPYLPQKINLASTSYDVQSEWDAGLKRFTAKEDGKYAIFAVAEFADMQDQDIAWLALYKNGIQYSVFYFHQSTAPPSYMVMFIPDVLALTAGDYIEVWLAQQQMTNRLLWGGETITYLSIAKIA